MTNAGMSSPRVVVRHYCQGIGDCHLLRFPKDDGSSFWMLIDCGIHSSVTGGKQMMSRVVEDIAKQTSRLDVVVATHEHVDHLSGFFSEVERFKSISVGEVWLGWTENPADPQAQALDKFKGAALDALQGAGDRLSRAAGLDANLTAVKEGIEAVMGFSIGIKGERVRAQRDAVVAMAPRHVRYLEPSNDPLATPGVPGLRVYVLGPPRDARLLGITNRSDELYSLAPGFSAPMAKALAGAFAYGDPQGDGSRDDAAPFDANVGTDFGQLAACEGLNPPTCIDRDIAAFARAHYFGPAVLPGRKIRSRAPKSGHTPQELDQSWRRIDHDWLAGGAELAMQLDSRTNNTSLALAFEFTDTGRVLLFAADAQVGSWLSWQDLSWQVGDKTVTGPDLLARTVYYKVGHHGSENATLKAKGLERMMNPDLASFIPVNEADAKKFGWVRMPLPSLVDTLGSRCKRRTIRADDPWLAEPDKTPPFDAPSGSIKSISRDSRNPALWVELGLE